MSALRLPWTLTLSIAAAILLLTLGLLWAGVPWQLPALLATITAALVGTVSS